MPRIISSFKIGIVLAILLNSLSSLAFDRWKLQNTSFEKNENRYPSVLAIIENIKRMAPFQKAIESKTEIDSCLQISAESAPLLGAIDPIQLLPLENQPSALFFNYFEKCTKQMIQRGFSDSTTAKKNSDLILGGLLASTNWSTTQFSQLPAETKNQIVDRFIYFLLGPEDVIRYFKYIGPQNVFGASLESSIDLRNFLTENILKNYPHDSLLEFYIRIATLLRLGPALRN